MKHLLIVAVAALLLSGCATQSFDVNPPLSPLNQPSLEDSQPFFIGGVGQSSFVDAAEVCGGAENIVRIEAEQSVLDGILSLLTSGIYTPRTARVYCSS